MRRVPFTRRVDRSARVVLPVLVVALLVMASRGFTTPGQWPYGVAVLAGIALFAAVALRSSTSLEVGEDAAVLVQQRLVRRHAVPLGAAERIALRTNSAGGLLLVARRGRTTAFGSVLSLGSSPHSQSPELLLLLAAAVRSAPAPGAADVARRLEEQEAAVRAGRAPADTPLAAAVRDLTGAAGAAGGAGVVAGLL